MSNPTVPLAEDNIAYAAPQKRINWGRAVFFVGLLGCLISFISQYLPDSSESSGLLAGACIVTLAAIASYITLFQESGRKFAFWSMLIFSIASPVLFFSAFMSYM